MQPRQTSAITVNRDAVMMCSDLSSSSQLIIYPCTNSGYGVGQDGIYCDENTPLNQFLFMASPRLKQKAIFCKRAMQSLSIGNCLWCKSSSSS